MVDSRGAFVGAIRSGDSVDVGTNLRFEVVADEIGEAEIFWQVVNTGVEAERAGDLRGKLFRDTSVRKEVARYRGEHFVEAFLVRQGVCVARSGEFVVQIR